MYVFAAVFWVLKPAVVPIATVALPTKVLVAPEETVIAPLAEPRFIKLQSKAVLIASPKGTAASVNVPVGSVNATATAEVVVTIPVSSCAAVSVADALMALGAGLLLYATPKETVPTVATAPSVTVLLPEPIALYPNTASLVAPATLALVLYPT